jgi:DNA-binding transcriptional LysR family regulator
MGITLTDAPPRVTSDFTAPTYRHRGGENRFTDIVAERFDTGVRVGADIAKDMIGVPMAPDMRMALVGSPAYPQPLELGGHHGGLDLQC